MEINLIFCLYYFSIYDLICLVVGYVIPRNAFSYSFKVTNSLKHLGSGGWRRYGKEAELNSGS